MEPCLAGRQRSPTRAGKGIQTTMGEGAGLQEAWASKWEWRWKGAKWDRSDRECMYQVPQETRQEDGGRNVWKRKGWRSQKLRKGRGNEEKYLLHLRRGHWPLEDSQLDKALLLFPNSPYRNMDKKYFPSAPDETNWDMPYSKSYWSKVNTGTKTNGPELPTSAFKVARRMWLQDGKGQELKSVWNWVWCIH